ncbi:hypothetical protein [Pantoea vagans]|uniref:hypothetical protein n=1 Tax=Pantoea vagans TaxID=470934 RepID=UPI00066111B1|nr:hypothetical protein [Pantoea vagans]MDU6089827.1 hypothetical protein [Staphylococcus lugdunensis]
MKMEAEVGNITAFDNVNGQGILASVDFIDYEATHERIVVNVLLPLDKEATLTEVESRVLEKAKQQLRELVATF